MPSNYAASIGVTDADRHTARNIHLSVGDCKHLKTVLQLANSYIVSIGTPDYGAAIIQWNDELIQYLKGAV